VIGLPIVALRNCRRRTLATPWVRLTRGLVWLTSLLFVLFPVLLVMGLANLKSGISPLAKAALGAVSAVGLAVDGRRLEEPVLGLVEKGGHRRRADRDGVRLVP
jgi:hypothetical protein